VSKYPGHFSFDISPLFFSKRKFAKKRNFLFNRGSLLEKCFAFFKGGDGIIGSYYRGIIDLWLVGRNVGLNAD